MTKTFRTVAELAAVNFRIPADSEVCVPGMYIDFNGNTEDCAAKGARWTLRELQTEARIRDLVVA